MADAPTEELRIALAMNGGVSLAVWIGGVTREFARLAARHSTYAGLLDLVRYEPRIDVISGTSAGGVNGAYLAAALAYHDDMSLEAAMAPLRKLWVDNGSLDLLLRNPLDARPPSVLNGDGFYYDMLLEAFEQVTSTGTLMTAEARPIDLILTTTLLTGQPQNLGDDFGSSVADISHRGLFQFWRSPDDRFANNIAAKLALAARSTSSFPGAFEPSFIPVNETLATRPDMAKIASFQESHFVIDGGILDNKPLDAALPSIFKQKASKPARRVLAYVVPDPGDANLSNVAEKVTEAPGLLPVILASLIEIPSVQSISAQIRQLQDHNAAVRHKRRSRTLLTRYLSPSEIEALSTKLFRAYRDERAERALDDIVECLTEGLSKDPKARAFGPIGRKDWLHQQIYRLLDQIKWIPTHPPATVPNDEISVTGWHWGIRPAHRLARVCLDIMVRAQRTGALGNSDHAAQWRDVFDIVSHADALRVAEREYWTRKPMVDGFLAEVGYGISRPDNAKAKAWFAKALDGWLKDERPLAGALVERMAKFVRGIAGLIDPNQQVPMPPTKGAVPDAEEDLIRLVRFFATPGAKISDTDIVRNLLAFEVVEQGIGADAITFEEEIEFIQITGDDDEVKGVRATNSTGGPPAGDLIVQRAGAKLAGTQLSHFGAFYKRSWRANDWLWGRRDAVARIVRLTLSPQRLRKVSQFENRAAPVDHAMGKLKNIVTGFAVHSAAARDPVFDRMWEAQKDAVEKELAYLDRNADFIPESLPVTIKLLTTCFELSILREELPSLGAAIAADIDLGMAASQAVRDLPEGCKPTIVPHGEQNPSLVTTSRAMELADSCNLGGQRWQDEVGTDQATYAVSKTLAVTIATLKGDAAATGAMGKIVSAIRLPALILYGFAKNLALRTRTGIAVDVSIVAVSLVILVSHLLWKAAYPPVVMAAAVGGAVSFLIVLTTKIRSGILRYLLAIAIFVPAGLAAWHWLLGRDKIIWEELAAIETALLLSSVVIGLLTASFRLWKVGRWRKRRLPPSVTEPMAKLLKNMRGS